MDDKGLEFIDGKSVLYSQPGKHAFAPSADWFSAETERYTEPCLGGAGSMGVHVTPLLEDTYAKSDRGDTLVLQHLKRLAFKPTFLFDRLVPITQDFLVNWDELQKWIPGRVETLIGWLESGGPYPAPEEIGGYMAEYRRGAWGSKLGFILAASGSAIGLGNIVFFSANAYKYGAGAFYLPYLVALFLIGVPIMTMELGLGTFTGRAFPESMFRISGKWGELVGWGAVLNATVISMYYVTILAWVFGMLIGSASGALWQAAHALPAFAAIGELENPYGYFFDMLSSWDTVIYVFILWGLNYIIVLKGAKSIEAAVKIFVPMMWVFMIVLIVRGVTLGNGLQGVLLLFTPDFTVIQEPEVWRGAFSQMFFSLTLGFGVMTAYASYLPKDSDQIHNASTVSFLNCGFEFLAGLAIFSLLFVFSIVPKASTLSMMFFVVPQGIGNLPALVTAFGVLFFFTLLVAGLSSSISLVEAFVSALIDKFRWRRQPALLLVVGMGLLGGLCFALPQVVDPTLDGNGTLGLSILDLVNHWAFNYGLLLVGLLECVIIGWMFGAHRLREAINRNSTFELPLAWEWIIKIAIPAILLAVLLWSFSDELKGIYGSKMALGDLDWLPVAAVAGWMMFTVGVGALFTWRSDYDPEDSV